MLSFNRPVSLNSAPIGLITVSSQYYKYVKKVVIKKFRALVVFFIAGLSIWVGVLCLFVFFLFASLSNSSTCSNNVFARRQTVD